MEDEFEKMLDEAVEDYDENKEIIKSVLRIVFTEYDIQNMNEEMLQAVALDETIEMAQSGNVDAQYVLGECYFFGGGFLQLDQDIKKGVKWLSRAGRRGQIEAQKLLGNCYLIGETVQQDLDEAIEWLTLAAEQGDSDAQCALGGCYSAGIGVKQDIDEAINWLKRSAIQGNTNAITALTAILGAAFIDELLE